MIGRIPSGWCAVALPDSRFPVESTEFYAIQGVTHSEESLLVKWWLEDYSSQAGEDAVLSNLIFYRTLSLAQLDLIWLLALVEPISFQRSRRKFVSDTPSTSMQRRQR